MTNDILYQIVVWAVVIIFAVAALCATAAAIGLTIWLYKWLINKWKSYKPAGGKAKRIHKRRFADNYIAHALLIALAAVIVFGCALFAARRWMDFHVSDTKIVLTFIGVLATFIVVTNYAQVIEIKKDLQDRMSLIEKWQRQISNKWTDTDKFDKRPNTNTLPPAQPARPMVGKPNIQAKK